MPPVRLHILWIALAAFAAATPAFAQQSVQQDTDGVDTGPLRYSMVLIDGGIALLDRKTGELEYCSVQGGQFVCRLAVGEREGYEAEIARLRASLDALNAAPPEKPGEPSGQTGKPPEEVAPSQSEPDKPGPAPLRPETRVPDAEFDRRLDDAMRQAGRALRRFFDAVKELRPELEGGKS